jgi:hypothetical protein
MTLWYIWTFASAQNWSSRYVLPRIELIAERRDDHGEPTYHAPSCSNTSGLKSESYLVGYFTQNEPLFHHGSCLNLLQLPALLSPRRHCLCINLSQNDLFRVISSHPHYLHTICAHSFIWTWLIYS